MPEIIAAIVGAVVTGILGFSAYLYQQHRGNRVIVERLSQTPQITFSDAVQSKLEIIYNGRKIDNLVLTQFVISNKGNKIIKPLKLTMNVTPKSDNFTYAELNVGDPQDITLSKMDSTTGTFEIERSYLNPKTKYKEEEIKISVFSDVLLDFSVSGGGEDWASKLVLREDLARPKSYLYISLLLAVMLGFLVRIISSEIFEAFSEFGKVSSIIMGFTILVALIAIIAPIFTFRQNK